jgi:hypothetical protein
LLFVDADHNQQLDKRKTCSLPVRSPAARIANERATGEVLIHDLYLFHKPIDHEKRAQ